MKPIVDGKEIIAKLGDRILTTEELRRLPKGVKDRVLFYPMGATPEDELDEDLRASLHWKFIKAELDEKELSPEEYESLPKSTKGEVRFTITEKGNKVLYMEESKRNLFLHFDRWITKEEVSEMMNLSLNDINKHVAELIKDGLMEEQDGKFKSRESIKFLRVKDYLKGFAKENKDLIKGLTEWATREELAEQLGISLKEINESLDKQIEKGFIEEKDGKFRVNDSDGRGKERISNYLDELNKPLDKEMSFYDSISSMVMGGIYEAIKKGWVEFGGGNNYTAEEWKALTDADKEKIGIKLTDKGRSEIEDDSPLKIYDELAVKKREGSGLNLFKDVYEKDGEIQLVLTEDGERLKKLGELMGVRPEIIFKMMMESGLNIMMRGYMVIDVKGVEGNRRINRKVYK